MPENESPKLKPHLFKQAEALSAPALNGEERPPSPPYAELCITSNYTFLTGASHPEEFIAQAAGLGYRAVALTDTHSLAGIVRAHVAAKEAGIQFIIGSRIRPTDMPGVSLFLYPTAMESYRRLCRLLTTGKRRSPKGQCRLSFEDVAQHHEGLLAIISSDAEPDETFQRHVQHLQDIFDDDRLSLAASLTLGPDDAARLDRMLEVSSLTGVPLVATNDAHYHHPERRMLHDIVTCIRHGCTLSQAGLRLHASSERHLKPPEEMHRLFVAHPQALARTVQIAERTRGLSLDQLRYEYPEEVVPPGKTAQQYLTELAWQGANHIYANNVSDKVRAQIEHELRLIEELNYAPYFLTVYDLVRFARTGEELPGQEPAPGWPGPILCQGRGAAANSAVCFCLGVTAVDPTKIDLLFERFVSKERNEPPDIDIDFEHERREEVIQYIYRKYGRDRAALTAEVITYRRRSAVRDVGKALGLSLDLVDRLAKDIEWFDHGSLEPRRLRELGLNPDDPTLRWLARLVTQILGFPRHLSQHVGGFVITRSPLCELVPVENAAMPERTVIEWDKDDIDAAGMLKVDVLGLGMLTALAKGLKLMNDSEQSADQGVQTSNQAKQFDAFTRLCALPPEDPDTYRMIQRADTVGVFQIESRAQMSMLPRLKPRCFYDLVIEVAIVRPGPIQGDMVHPYLKRRNGEEEVIYAHKSIKEVLEKTLGVPLFQEQCMALAVKAAGFTAGQADQLRRAMAAWKRKGDQIHRFGQQLIKGMVKNDIPEEYARRCFEQIKGFSEYGFPESHAASFALLVYASAWLKHHYPAEFCAALLNSQPMGFYAPAQLIRDAKEHGVEVRPVDVNQSAWDCTIEEREWQSGEVAEWQSEKTSASLPSLCHAATPPLRHFSLPPSVRLGLRLTSGLSKPEADRIHAAVRDRGPFFSLLSLWRASGVKAGTMRRLAAADAFGSMGLSRQQALWQARLLRDEPLPLFDQLSTPDAPAARPPGADGLDRLPAISPQRQVTLDYDATGVSLKAHPVSFIRERLNTLHATCCADLRDAAKTPEGQLLTVAGLVLVRQRPGTANEVTFITLEDETGIANLIVWKRVYHKYRRAAAARLLVATGRVQRQGEVVHIVVTKLQSLDQAVDDLRVVSRNFH